MQVNPHEDVLFKVSASEIESSNTIKCFNKNNKKQNKKTNTNKMNQQKTKQTQFLNKRSRLYAA